MSLQERGRSIDSPETLTTIGLEGDDLVQPALMDPADSDDELRVLREFRGLVASGAREMDADAFTALLRVLKSESSRLGESSRGDVRAPRARTRKG